MQFSSRHRRISHLYLNYTLVFIVAALCMFGTYFLTGHSLIWRLDGANQHLPLLENFRTGLGDLLTGKISSFDQWSFQMGLGTDKFSVYSYYLIGDVFAYLTLLFPVAKVVTVYQWLIVLRLYCAGLSFVFLASHFKFTKNVITTGALVYLFNAFLLYSAEAQPFFTTPFIIFPLLILGIEKILQGGSAWPLTAAFVWMLLSNYYFAFVLGIGAILYLILRIGWYYLKELNYWQVFGKLLFATVTSLLLSAFMLVPEIMAVMGSTRAASSFANGLKVYPLYYYLALPSQFINGGNRDFYFWSALGFASIALFSVVFIFSRAKRYPLLSSTFILSFIMLLIPFFGAFFNGGMAPSNRWTLLLCLPIALATCELVQKSAHLSDRLVLVMMLALGIYALVIGLTYYFQSDEKLFVPLIFLFVSLGAILYVHYRHPAHPHRLILLVVLANVSLNAIYYEAPYNGGYSNEMLPQGAYQNLQKNLYSGLDRKLKPVDQGGYRVSTTSNNFKLGAGYHLYNSLSPTTSSLTSYYSLQNKYLGQFATDMQNIQYDANVPLRQVDDRTILNNFMGVRYIFNWLNQENTGKIPAGYYLNKTSQLVTDPNGDPSLDQQARRYRSDQAFPLVYWQDKVFTAKQQRQYTTSQKERALASGVKVSEKAAAGLTKGTVKDQTINVPYRLISSRGNEIDSQHLEKRDSDESYQIVLPRPSDQGTKAYYPGSELHVEITNIRYQPYSLKDQIKLEQLHQNSQGLTGLLAQNNRYNYYKYLRYHVLQGSPDTSYKLDVQSNLGTETLEQPKQNALSFYKKVTNGTLNMGYFKESLPKTLTLTPSKLGKYSFDLKVIAIPLAQSGSYAKQVAQIKKDRLKNIRINNDQVSGTITTKKAGILTSTIPYSEGWHVQVNGKAKKVLRTNTAFLGVKLNRGKHNVKFTYHLPGERLGKQLSLLGLILSLLGMSFALTRRFINQRR
ncbi:membrane protein [Ligilactobacillus salitolerans]|uniref:Membrane protein n=1 Tax=Ligilactobacillus salitolerans TaxID=1808352 RepID=A0A401IV61_9LACO|nr:YfhO family protein [Ligilactobacillus salitolerans]GBG95440.1 membrane protein [Ligilactobacillus salitolerans]